MSVAFVAYTFCQWWLVIKAWPASVHSLPVVITSTMVSCLLLAHLGIMAVLIEAQLHEPSMPPSYHMYDAQDQVHRLCQAHKRQ